MTHATSQITVETRQYPTYVLTDGATGNRLEVVPERGGIVVGWQVQGQELFYLDAERFQDPSLSVRGGIPLLFPICGNLVNDTYTLNGQAYTLPQHGFARTLPWQVSQQTTTDGVGLTVTLTSTEATRAVYPFDFELNYTYTLRGNSLELRFSHTNRSTDPMPFSAGIHPYFAVADKQQLAINLPATQYQIKGAPELYDFPGQFDFSQDEIDFAFVQLTGQTATVTDQAANYTLTVDFDAHYPVLVFWTVKGKNFYCLEPWSGPRNAMNTGSHLLTVPPQETLETVITLTAEMG